MGRAKLVYQNFDELVHIWAHSVQPEARCGNGEVCGPTIFSYGRHFPVGTIVKRGTRPERVAVLITTETYSTTTAKHIWSARSATRHLETFRVPLGKYDIASDYSGTFKGDTAAMFESYAPRMAKAVERASKARMKRAEYVREAQSIASEANRFAEFFGLRSRLNVPADYESALVEATKLDEAAKKRAAARLRREAKARAIREAAALAEYNAKLSDWRENKIGHIYGTREGFAALRVSADGTAIETSQSASVPIDHARRAFAVIARIRARGETYHRNGKTYRVGHFAIDGLDEFGHLTIGCHFIHWAEVQAIADRLGWAMASDADAATAEAAALSPTDAE